MAQKNDNLSVARSLAASVKTLLGPQHGLKCCTSDGDAVICSSTSKLLQFIDIQHPAGFIINDACQGQYKKYRTNCTTLVCLTGFWSSTVQDLQNQGVPVPIILRLLDAALEVCEEVCQEMSIPVTEALQSHHMSYPAAKDCDVAATDNVKDSTAESSCCAETELGRLEKSGINSGDDDNDISWYFDGQIPGVDSFIPGIDNHIPGIDGHILGADGEIPGVDSHILGSVGDIPGVRYHIREADFNMPRAISKELMKKSYFAMEVPGSDLLEISSPSERFSMDSFVVSHSPSKLLESTSENLLPKKEGEHVDDDDNDDKDGGGGGGGGGGGDDDDDEFEACFQDYVSNSANKNLGGKIAELSITKERKEIFPSGVETKVFGDTSQKINCAKLENTAIVETSNATKRKVMNRVSLSSSGCKEKEVTDKLVSLLSEKLQSKNKGVGRQIKMSEIFKGSRHLMGNSLDQPLSEMSSASIINQSREPSFSEERYRKSEACSASETSIQSLLKAGQTGKPDVVDSTPCKRENCQENITEQNQHSFVRKKTEELKLIEKSKELLAKLGSRLSHGKEKEMNLAVEVVTSLFLSSGKTSLEDFLIHLRMIHTELIQGPSSSFSQKVDGLLLESTASYQSVNRTAPEAKLFIVLVNGDVTPEFRHVGLNKEFQIHRIIENKDDLKASRYNQKKDWDRRVTDVLLNHKIGLLVVKGIVDSSVLDFCLSHNIVVLQNVSYPALQLLSFATDSTIVTYLTDLREQDVGRPVTIETWELGWTPLLAKQSKSKAGGEFEVTGMKAFQYVLVKEVQGQSTSCEDSNSSLQTVLLCNPCNDVLCDMEERFWNSIHRLKNALSCGRVLPGAGAVEVACIRRLNELAGEQNEPRVSLNPLSGWLQESLEMFRPLVYTAFAQGFRGFLGNVLQNSGKFTAPCGVSAHVEQVVNSTCSLDIFGSFSDENSEDNPIELQNSEEITHPNRGGHVTGIPARDLAGSGSPIDPARPNSFCADPENVVWDDYTAKKEAWRRAVGIVRILVQSDMLVQTGLGRSESEAILF